MAWKLWLRLNKNDRTYGAMGGIFPLTTTSVYTIVAAYGEGLDTFEKILLIEDEMFPALVAQSKPET
jgi:hypothetical protein